MSILIYNIKKYGKDVEMSDRIVRTVNNKLEETFPNSETVRAITTTVNGVSVFDSTNTETAATHKITMLFIAGITAEKYLKIASKRLRVLTVENCCENDKVLILMCTERGLDSVIT